MSKMKIAVTGAAGRMGRELVRTIHGREDCVVAGAIEQEGSIALGQDVGQEDPLVDLGPTLAGEPGALSGCPGPSAVGGIQITSLPAAAVLTAKVAVKSRRSFQNRCCSAVDGWSGPLLA